MSVLVFLIASIVSAQYTADLTNPTDAQNGAATASTYWDVNYPYNAFDNDPAYPAAGEEWPYDLWGSDFGTFHWLKYDFGTGNAKTIAQYRIMTSPDYKPDDWTFEGSNNDSNWDVLHTVNNAAPADHTWLTYQISNTTAYRYYRIYITDITSDSPATDYVDIAEMEMMEAESADITFTNGANAALDFQQVDADPPENNWLLGQFSLAGDATGATLNSVTVTLGGSYSSSDFGSNPFRLFARNTINDFSGASAVGSDVAYAGSGSDITFSGLSDGIPSGIRYYWVTADISASAAADDNINGTVDAAGDLDITGGVLSGSSAYGKLNAGDDASLPVGLVSFSAVCENGAVTLSWVTESETDNAGFILERCAQGGEWVQIASYQTHDALRGQGNTSGTTEYEFVDRNILWGESYEYRLSDVDIHGTITLRGVLTMDTEQMHVPERTDLKSVWPNPFNPTTSIRYDLSRETKVSLTVFDLLGRRISSLISNHIQPAGSYQWFWNGKDDSGNLMPSGTYILHLQTDSFAKSQKMLLMR